ncbi:hypothetical protein QBC37DRAFT_391144 [Rhypophila decipiens]|uniref:Uncharacterized protein n=1 Tax=Rhypophila decipiens TaxID=261697 RepID=A0AAN6XZH7_9PEZI|nr:hypothetical protein QBC37DRAFT_391144 [Rhypophila decipiens]
MVHLPVASADVVAVASATLPSAPTQITPSPATEHVELRLRQNAAPTCAYLSGDTASPLTCGSNFSCSRGTYLQFGCCNKLECDANYAIGCIDPSNQQCQLENYEFDCEQMKYIGPVLTCTNACVTYVLKVPGAYSTGTYRSYSCGNSGATRIALATPTNGAGGDDSGDGNGGGQVGGGFPTLDIPGQETTAAGSGGTNNGGNSGNNNNNNGPPNQGASEASISAGTIAGIAIGGAVGAVLVGLGIWWMCRRKSKKAPPPNYSQTVVSGWLDQTH